MSSTAAGLGCVVVVAAAQADHRPVAGIEAYYPERLAASSLSAEYWLFLWVVS